MAAHHPKLNYLVFLEKEMTIMGLLSGATAAASAGVLSSLLHGDSIYIALLWSSSRNHLLIGCGFLLISCGLFFKQRSQLARLYGQICRFEDEGASAGVFPSTKSLARICEADGWITWIAYS
jgi:hypothetical protein